MKFVCFQHAGSLSPYYNFLKKLNCCSDFKIFVYAGRENKLLEPFYSDFNDCIMRAGEELNNYINTNEEYVIFGHSMGAYIAYEVAIQMQNFYNKPAKCIIVSGQTAPTRYEKVKIIDDNKRFLNYLSVLGGIDKELAQNEELMDLMLPIVRSDFILYNKYVPTCKKNVLNSPLAAVYGQDDLAFDTKYIDDWSSFTRHYLGSKKFPGDHFYFNKIESDFIHYLGSIITN